MSSLAGASSTAVRGLLTGPETPARVLGVHPSCVYVVTGDDMVVIESADALGLPCAVRLGVDRVTQPFRSVRAGDTATVGLGRLVTAGLTVRVGRWWAPRRAYAGSSPARIGAIARLLRTTPCPVPVEAGVADLLGRGDGLTPAGDDVLAGFLVAAHHCPEVRDQVAVEVLRQAPGATTTLSAALLRHAAAGHALPAVLDVADLLAGHGPGSAVAPALSRLLRVGHSSGTALAHGLLRGARCVAHHVATEAAA